MASKERAVEKVICVDVGLPKRAGEIEADVGDRVDDQRSAPTAVRSEKGRNVTEEILGLKLTSESFPSSGHQSR